MRNLYYKYLYKVTYKLWMLFTKLSNTYGLALMYHHVTDEDIDAMEICKCRVSVFENVLERLRTEGYVFVNIDEALQYIKNRTKKKFVIVTFDDVPENVYQNAYPILKKLNIPFTLFMTTDFIDKPGYLTKAELLEMDLDPLCTIGAHTKSHLTLRGASNSFEEMSESKRILEKLVGHPIDYMAYPYGLQISVSRKAMKQAKAIGYKCAFGTIQTPISDFSSHFMYYLPRVIMNQPL